MSYKNMLSKIRASGLTQVEIAQRIGRSQSVVSDIENGLIKDVRASTASAIEALYREVSHPETRHRRTDRRKADRRVADRREP